MPNEGVGESDPEPEPSLEIPAPKESSSDGPSKAWTLTANNKNVIRGWQELCRQIPENARRCYDWLREDPTRRIPGRCYELKYKHYAGAWCYEIGSGQRVYYKLRAEQKDVLVYYAGRHPITVPYPP